IQFRLHSQGDRPEGRRRMLDLDHLSVFQPAPGSRKEKAERLRHSIIVKVQILDEHVTENREPFPIAGAVRRTKEDAAALIEGRERAAFSPDEGVASKTVRQHSVEI